MKKDILKTRLEIIIGIALVIVVSLGILFFIFRVVPVDDSQDNQDSLPSLPVEEVKYLDVSGKASFTVADKTVNLPLGSVIISGYNNTEASEFVCLGDVTVDCNIYDIDVSGTKFFLSNPRGIKLRTPVAPTKVEKEVNATGETITFTYTQRRFVNTEQDENGQVTKVIEVPELTTVEEIYGCNLTYNVCFESGRLSEDKAINDEQVLKFETFVQAVNIN